METIKCPKCGSEISSEAIERAMQYAHDCGFDEGYETALECELYAVRRGYQCGNCGYVHLSKVHKCKNCGSVVINVVDE
ncbi:MAG: hypothetical protein IKF14_05230 [Atopobiaceae bacterium]|nr:hypothetical protein [Atopobiaceae bacterium]MBR3158492.1 hypothetical protein [Atopobiaceae bacterium]